MLQNGFVRYEKVIITFFILLVLSAVVSYFDPIQVYKKYQDNKTLTDTRTLANALGNYKISTGRLPWGSKLPWTNVRATEIGVCGNSDCTEGGVLINSSKLSSDFLRSSVIVGSLQNSIYLLKSFGVTDPTYICFQPKSQEFRTKFQDLYKIDTKSQSVPVNPKQSSCTDNVNWNGDNVCYICIVQ